MPHTCFHTAMHLVSSCWWALLQESPHHIHSPSRAACQSPDAFTPCASLMVNTALLVLAFFYDIFWVFCSSAVFGSNVMVTVATQLDVPIKILVPLILSQEGTELQFTLIGLGDIVLPGLLLSFAMRFDDHKRISLTSGYFAVTMTGYVVGLTLCEIIVGAFHLAQPAMIYLVPGTLLPFYCMALYRGEVGEAWKGAT